MKFHKFEGGGSWSTFCSQLRTSTNNDECHFSYGQLVISFRLQWNSLRSNLPICHYYNGQLVISFRSKWNSLRSNFDRTVNLFHALFLNLINGRRYFSEFILRSVLLEFHQCMHCIGLTKTRQNETWNKLKLKALTHIDLTWISCILSTRVVVSLAEINPRVVNCSCIWGDSFSKSGIIMNNMESNFTRIAKLFTWNVMKDMIWKHGNRSSNRQIRMVTLENHKLQLNLTN